MIHYALNNICIILPNTVYPNNQTLTVYSRNLDTIMKDHYEYDYIVKHSGTACTACETSPESDPTGVAGDPYSPSLPVNRPSLYVLFSVHCFASLYGEMSL